MALLVVAGYTLIAQLADIGFEHALERPDRRQDRVGGRRDRHRLRGVGHRCALHARRRRRADPTRAYHLARVGHKVHQHHRAELGGEDRAQTFAISNDKAPMRRPPVTQGALDGVAGFVIQALLILILLPTADFNFEDER